MPLERRPGLVLILEAFGAGAVSVALLGGRDGYDLDGAAFLFAVRHRLAHAAGGMAPDGGRIEENGGRSQKGAPQAAVFVIPSDSWTPIFPRFRMMSRR